jgi:arylsulfatase A-like enzyme
LILLALGLGAWYALLRPVERPNVLLITVDTLRADHLGTYGYERETSPTIDALAASGVVFDNAFAQAILSGPSHATIFTSLHTPVHGVINNGVVMDPDNLTFTELLRASGYTTAMFVSHDLMSAEFGFDQGFEVSENHPIAVHRHRHDDDEEDEVGAMAPLESLFDAVIAWLDRPRDKPFFVWMHVQHPHMSWEPPPPYDTMFGESSPLERYDLQCRDTLYAHRAEKIRLNPAERTYVVAMYDGEIAYVDDQIERVLSAVRKQDRESVVAVAADHGELLFDGADQRLVGHGHRSSEPILRVPLILHGPGVPRGPRVEPMVGLIDLAPTLLELAGITAPKSFQGTSLVPLMHGRSEGVRSQNFSGTIHFDGRRRLAVREERWKLVCKVKISWTCELFDLVADPGEQEDLAPGPRHAEELDRLRHDLRSWFRDVVERGQLLEIKPPDARARAILKRAGYLTDDLDTFPGSGP